MDPRQVSKVPWGLQGLNSPLAFLRVVRVIDDALGEVISIDGDQMRRATFLTIFMLLVLVSVFFNTTPAVGQDLVILQAVEMYKRNEISPELTSLLQNALLDPGKLDRDDRLRARVYLALTLLALGDTVRAVPVIHAAKAQEPCLQLRSDLAPPNAVAVFDWARRFQWCSVTVGKAWTLSALVPGSSQVLMGDRGLGAAFFSGAVGGILLGSIELGAAHRTYHAYEDARNTEVAERLFNQSVNQWRIGAALIVSGTGIWVLNIVNAHKRAKVRTKEIELAKNYAIQLDALPNARGLAMSGYIRF
jgi:hypothetical protein